MAAKQWCSIMFDSSVTQLNMPTEHYVQMGQRSKCQDSICTVSIVTYDEFMMGSGSKYNVPINFIKCCCILATCTLKRAAYKGKTLNRQLK
jgi:hypothetical protein